MKAFRQVKLHGSSAQIGALRDELSAWTSTATWRRNVQLAHKVHGAARDAVVFEYTGVQAPGAFVFLLDEAQGARVTNIVPKSAGSLSIDEYNHIAASFAHEVLCPLAEQLAIGVEVSPPEKSLEDLLPAAAASALRRFSTSANRATGTEHPQDAAKWDLFVILAHREHASMAPDALRRWLVEDEQWDEEIADDLALQYESARRLLASNDEFKAA